MGDLAAIVIFVIVMVVIGLVKVLRQFAGGTVEDERQPGPYKASQNQIGEFLRQLGMEPAPPRALERPPGEQAPEPQRMRVQETLAPSIPPLVPTGVVELVPEPEEPAAAPPPRPPRHEPRRAPEMVAPSPRKRKRTVGTRPPARKGRRPAESVARLSRAPGGSLKQAVVWSEILGKPLSLRPSLGYRPPSADQ